MPGFSPRHLVAASALVLEAADTPSDIAQRVAESLVLSERSGHVSHGVIRIPDYVRHQSEGRLDPAARPAVAHASPVSVVVDGNLSYGQLGAQLLTDEIVVRARRSGVAVGTLVRTAHIGRLGEWSEQAIAHDIVFLLCFGPLRGIDTAPFGGAERRLSTNPLTFGAGTATDEIVLDIATTVVAAGKVRHHRDRGEDVPIGWVLDAEGQPTTDAHALDHGGTLVPVGGHKGYGLAVMIATLGAALGAGGAGYGADVARSGVFAIGIDPGIFGDREGAHRLLNELLGDLRATRPAEGHGEVLVPGDIERRLRDQSEQAIVVADAVWYGILATAERLGADPEHIDAVANGTAAS